MSEWRVSRFPKAISRKERKGANAKHAKKDIKDLMSFFACFAFAPLRSLREIAFGNRETLHCPSPRRLR